MTSSVRQSAPALASPSGAAEALRRLAEGPDAVAWAWLAEHEGPAMYRVAARMLSAGAADDVCQEALLHVRAGARHFKPPGGGDDNAAARAWLLRITTNAAAMWLRSERRRVVREQQTSDRRSIAHEPAADLDALRQAVAELPEAQRLPLVLHHFGGQDFVAIAAACGTTPGAARVRAHRGLAKLREQLTRVGVVSTAAALLNTLIAQEITLPVGSVARWAAVLTSTSKPAVATTAIFGGISIMSKIALTCVGITAAGLLTFIRPSMAEEHHEKPAEKPKHGEEVKAGGDAKKEGLDALPAGTKGVTEGTIVSKEKSKLVVHTKDGNLIFAPYWHGGNPKDGGGLDKEMVSKLEQFAVGDAVRITWTWEERRRIDSITKARSSTAANP